MRIASLISMIFVFAFQSLAEEATLRKNAVIRMNDCSSLTLLVRLNIDNQTSKRDLVSAVQTLGEYSDLRISPVAALEKEIAFQVSPYCFNNHCRFRWNELQRTLLPLSGVGISCDMSVIPPSAGAGEGPDGGAQEDQTSEDKADGGVTGSNGQDKPKPPPCKNHQDQCSK